LPVSVRVIADLSLFGLSEMVTGANKIDTHYARVSMSRDIKAEFADIKQASAGDPCGECGGSFKILRGIEVGHIFYLGTKYSKAMNASVQNEHGENITMEMGCYGIGVTRTAAAAIEQNHDDKGIVWPVAIAPYHVHIVQMGVDIQVVKECLKLYQNLNDAGIEVLYDDRDERAGVKLNDADLIGCPLRLTIGKRGVEAREFEVLPRHRHNEGALKLSLDSDYIDRIKELLVAC